MPHLHFAAQALDRAYMNRLIPNRTVAKMERIAWPKRPGFRRREWTCKARPGAHFFRPRCLRSVAR